ncbi:MAG TPA: tetratricopeptide repeat protein [Chromatiaceae bacterium]|nr:tetratricopeptide repeat protein [Chromatiaceae bacterium]
MNQLEKKLQRAIQHYMNGELKPAADLSAKLARKLPNHPGLLQLRGEIAQNQGKDVMAEDLFRKAIIVSPQDSQPHYRLANVLFARQQLEDSILYYNKSLALDPSYWQARVNLGLAYRGTGQHQIAKEHFEQALQQNPSLTSVFCYLIDLKLSLGELASVTDMASSIEAMAQRCIQNDAETDFLPLIYLAPLLSLPDGLLRGLLDKLNRLYTVSNQSPPQLDLDSNRKIRIGYLSGDFGDHPISHVLWDVFETHDHEQFTINAYSTATRKSDTDKIYIEHIRKYCDDYVDLSALSLPQARKKIIADEIDILINLSGYMSPQCIQISAMQPAPLQAYWLGHGGGLGLSFIDYVIADKIVIPPGDEDSYREAILRLPESYHCAPTPLLPECSKQRSDYGLSETAFVFCAFNNPNKIDSAVFDSWMNILRRVADSQIWLSSPGKDDSIKRNFSAEAIKRGINPDRLVYAARVPDKLEHLARHSLADLFIDTFTYSASTTAIDALWSGLPILTRAGNNFFSRIGASHSTHVGLEQMVCDNTQAFEDRAVMLAQDPDALAEIKNKLAQGRVEQPLFQPARFCAHLEQGYRSMWQRHCDASPPATIEIEAINAA